jgi:hypothetical protein
MAHLGWHVTCFRACSYLLLKPKKGVTMQTESTETLNEESFNISNEFEDIQFVINTLSGQAEMEVASRRC